MKIKFHTQGDLQLVTLTAKIRFNDMVFAIMPARVAELLTPGQLRAYNKGQRYFIVENALVEKLFKINSK